MMCANEKPVRVKIVVNLYNTLVTSKNNDNNDIVLFL